MAKKLIAGGIVVVAVLAYVVFANRSSNSVATTDPSSSTNSTDTSNTSAPAETTNPAAGSSGATPTTGSGSTGTGGSSGTATAGAYTDGTYTGPATNAVYGTVQVAAVISGGKLTGVNVLQKPDAPGHTTDVSAQSLPILVKEAIAAQSAQVDVVSGATQTSEAFQQSLSAALSSAQT